MTDSTLASTDQYIATFPAATQALLRQVRATIKSIVPQAEEVISYGIPTFKLDGVNLVHFAGFAHHIGFYPAPVGMEAFQEDFAKYKTGKGSVQFPLDQPLPLDLIRKVTEYRLSSVAAQPKKKQKKIEG